VSAHSASRISRPSSDTTTREAGSGSAKGSGFYTVAGHHLGAHLAKLRAKRAEDRRSLRPRAADPSHLVPLVPLVGLLPPALRNCQKVDHPESFVLRNCGNTPKPPKAPRYSHWSLSHSRGVLCELRHLAHCREPRGALSMVPQPATLIRTSRAKARATKASQSVPLAVEIAKWPLAPSRPSAVCRPFGHGGVICLVR
jgi:hypothetical protein